MHPVEPEEDSRGESYKVVARVSSVLCYVEIYYEK
jgi:hypothetical protein